MWGTAHCDCCGTPPARSATEVRASKPGATGDATLRGRHATRISSLRCRCFDRAHRCLHAQTRHRAFPERLQSRTPPAHGDTGPFRRISRQVQRTAETIARLVHSHGRSALPRFGPGRHQRREETFGGKHLMSSLHDGHNSRLTRRTSRRTALRATREKVDAFILVLHVERRVSKLRSREQPV